MAQLNRTKDSVELSPPSVITPQPQNLWNWQGNTISLSSGSPKQII
jgi:hypothetical protein